MIDTLERLGNALAECQLNRIRRADSERLADLVVGRFVEAGIEGKKDHDPHKGLPKGLCPFTPPGPMALDPFCWRGER
ncbi:MAG: hypothetical protein GX442_21900 [Candidatus Riflebacteria bacterium]|nr:hypothetical protein [Candidatus Riflebacteria bacterium]